MTSKSNKMKNKYHIKVLFKWFDLWIGIFIDKPTRAVYICLLPMLPVKIWITEHKPCPQCKSFMHKIAINTGDGWVLEWECDQCDYITEGGIEWPFGDKWMTSKDLDRFGYELV